MAAIIETLAERVYAHGHAIGILEAQEIGLPVEEAPEDLDRLMWRLLNAYEDDLRLREPIDPIAAVAEEDVFTEEATTAVLESSWGLHEHTGEIEIRAKRQMPPNITVNMNMNLQVPPDLSVAGAPSPQAAQALLQQVM
jgi:hypothetical protein